MLVRYTLLILLGLAFAWQSSLHAQTAEIEQLFENSIRPILAGSCFTCHGDANTKLAGGLRVDSRAALLSGGDSGPAIDLDHPEESLLLKAIARGEGVSPMPPDNDRALRPDEVAAFQRWIAAGAPWPSSTSPFESRQHWAFQPLKATEQARGIDYWIAHKQSQAQTAMAPSADKYTLLRRATFDLTGLPPTYEQVLEFQNDSAPDAFRRLIDRLLESPAYGERWGRHWLDIVRYADTAGETADYPVPNAWRYRNYVIEALNQDKPYDQFLREQIAGDILAENESSSTRYASMVTATGYLAISRRFGFDSENYHHLTIQDTLDTLGQSVLGLSLGCARCHDHKFDPISMQDYYALYGIFDSSRYAFPGSEQKQKVRSMMPLVPAREALVAWRRFDQQLGAVRQRLERNGQSVTPAVLRMLNDTDGDFELQAPAAGGSNGVLVPPWIAEGPVSVSHAAQSPFRQIYGTGKSGIRIDATDSSVAYRVSQAIYPQRTALRDRRLQFTLDFRVPTSGDSSVGAHQLWLGSYPNSMALMINIHRDRLSWIVSNESASSGSLPIQADQWQHLQIVIDLQQRSFDVKVGQPGQAESDASSAAQRSIPLAGPWNGAIDYLQLHSGPDVSQGMRPALEIDNIAIMEPIDSAASDPVQAPQPAASRDVAKANLLDNTALDPLAIQQQLTALVGMDSDFELQQSDSPPSAPWNAGPNSVVKIMTRSQSPARSVSTAGQLGVHMPNRGEYDGFGCVLVTPWKAASQDHLSSQFDFCCADAKAGGGGSWRFYIGHGPGNSAAVELFFNDQHLFTRSGDDRTPVGELQVGRWYRVELQLNLKDRKFHGQLRDLHDAAKVAQWHSQFASGWDGTIDYTFIDSYGHLGGVRPALDVDNYVVTANSPNRPELAGDPQPIDTSVKRQTVLQLREQLARAKEQLINDAQALQQSLANGPFDLAYAVAEGTPHDVAIQLRGEPSQPGEVVRRGFVKVLGGKPLPANTRGSGRRELAEWLTRDVSALTARVMVNRIWQYHFGRGLVATPNDFGVRGAAPTHPELLDELAQAFIASGWSIKAMHRQIMSSQAYQQASIWSGSEAAQGLSRDLYVGFTRRRLSAEEIRDAILTVSGLLDRQPGEGHPFAPPTTWGYTQHGPFSAVYDHDKRSIYLMTQRLKRHPFLALFDGPDPNASTAVRLGTTVPTQALYFMNDPFVHRASAQRAKALDPSLSKAEQVARIYEMTLQRLPAHSESAAAQEFLADYQSALSTANNSDGTPALAALFRTLIGSNEFLHVD